jgi:nicotinate-nucleotide adenylyltransferase
MRSIAIFGGSFDPIHNGHLKISIAIQTQFNFDSYIFLPCKTPAIKPPTHANSQQRIEMIRLAIKGQHHFKLDLREIQRDTPSYMVKTLESFRVEYPQASITLILGYDAFLSLASWYQWEKIILLSHLLVIDRDAFSKQPVLEIMQEFLKKHQTRNKIDLLSTQAGTVYLFNAGHYNISSTLIREEIKKKGNNVKNKLPQTVYEFIMTQDLYQ